MYMWLFSWKITELKGVERELALGPASHGFWMLGSECLEGSTLYLPFSNTISVCHQKQTRFGFSEPLLLQ